MELKFKMLLHWFDARVLFYNLKMDEKINHLSLQEKCLNGNGIIIEKKVNEDIETFLGSRSPIIMSRVYSTKVFCDYNM